MWDCVDRFCWHNEPWSETQTVPLSAKASPCAADLSELSMCLHVPHTAVQEENLNNWQNIKSSFRSCVCSAVLWQLLSFPLELLFWGLSEREDLGIKEAAVSSVDSWRAFPYPLTCILMLISTRGDYIIILPRASFFLSSGLRCTLETQSLCIPGSVCVEYNRAVILSLSTAHSFSDLTEVPGLNYI